MENLDGSINEKPKGNILQNENREDEASPTDHSGLKPHPKMPEEPAENVRPHPGLQNKENLKPDDAENETDE